MLVVDLRPGDPPPLQTALSATRLRRLPDAADTPPGAIVVAVHEHCDGPRATQLAAWAQTAGVAVLAVAIEPGRTVLGPLTLPGRAGCGHCARERMLAAAAGGGGPAAGTGDEDGARVRATCDELDARLREILAAGPHACGLLDHVIVIDGGGASRHGVVPLARCRVCGGAAGPHAGARRPAAGGDPLSGWVGGPTAVIPWLTVDGLESALPVTARAASPHVLAASDGALRCLPAGWGKGLTASHAALSAIGEAIERYSASLPDPACLVWRRPDELDAELLDPRLLALYTDEQYARAGFPYVRFDPAARHPWVRGRWLGSDAEVWVPAVTVYLSLAIGPENLICQGTSNGLAASTDRDDAALRATLELVERDAMMAAWLTGDAATRVTLDDALDPALAAVVDGLAAEGCALEAYLLPAAACGSVALCLGLGDGLGWPGVAIGMAADLDPAAAIRQAILELGQTGPYLAEELRAGTAAVTRDATAVRDMRDHAAYYFPAERASAFDAVRAATRTVALSDLAAARVERSPAACAAALADVGVRVAIVDVTSADVATGPFQVVRAVSPDLQPISYGYGLDRVPVRRIRERSPAAAGHPIHPIS